MSAQQFATFVSGFGIILLLSACSTTHQARKATASGFLGDYSQLQKGAEGEALLIYRNPEADFSSYRSIMLDPVRIYASEDSKLAGVPREQLQSLANYLDAAIREQLKSDYAFVTSPGEDTLHLRVAITEAKGSRMALDTLSNVLPPAIALSALKQLATGVPTGVGSAAIEAELLDARSGQRLMAAVDERVGGKTFQGKFDKWDDVTDAYDYWAQRLKDRLAEERAGK